MFILALEIRRMFLHFSSWIFNVYFLENHQALCRLERGRMRRGRSLTHQAPPPPHNVPASLNRVGSRNRAALHSFPGTLQTPPNTLKKNNGMTRSWALEEADDKKSWVYLPEADGNLLGIQLPLLLLSGTLNSDYKGTEGRAPLKMDTFFLEVSRAPSYV